MCYFVVQISLASLIDIKSKWDELTEVNQIIEVDPFGALNVGLPQLEHKLETKWDGSDPETNFLSSVIVIRAVEGEAYH